MEDASYQGSHVNKILSALKEVWVPQLCKTYNSKTYLLDKLVRSSAGITRSPSGGKYVNIPLEVNPNTHAGFVPEGGDFVEPGSSSYDDAQVYLRELYSSAGFTDRSEAQTKSEVQSVINSWKTATDNAYSAINRSTNRALYGNQHGGIARVDAVSGVGSVGDPFVIEILNKQVFNGNWIRLNEQFCTGTISGQTATVTAANVIIVTKVTRATGLIEATIKSGSPAPAIGHRLFPFQSQNHSIVGLDQILNDVTNVFQGLDPATVGEQWRPVRLDGANAAISVEAIDRLLEQLDIVADVSYRDGADKVLLMTDLEQRRNLYDEITDKFAFSPQAIDGFKPGGNNWGSIVLPSGHTIDSSSEFIPRAVAVINPDDLLLIGPGSGPALLDGKPVQRFDRKARKEVILQDFLNVGVKRRNSHGILHNLAV